MNKNKNTSEKKTYDLTGYFGDNLATMLAEKIHPVYSGFESTKFIKHVKHNCPDKTLTQRVELIADGLHQYLPNNYIKAIDILLQILGPENPKETGMFTNYYWVMPIGKYVEKYGLNDLNISLDAIQEITKRNTGEYAIRPYVRQYPQQTLKRMQQWAMSDSFHLRRLASEGLRPKLPWAGKLDLFIDKPKPVFDILELLKEDKVKFVQKSVANHLTDYLKVNYDVAAPLIKQWRKSKNKQTQWILKHATRKITV